MTSSWLPIPASSPFSLANLPFGIISTSRDPRPRPAVAVGEHALDLSALTRASVFSTLPELHATPDVFLQVSLNAFAATGQSVHRAVRAYLRRLLAADTPFPERLRDAALLRQEALVLRSEVTNHLPLRIGDYTDFYAGLNHARRVGELLRGPDRALQPNYRHLPVAYHGRASSVVVSGTPIRRPAGQVLMPAAEGARAGPPGPTHRSSRKLDYELELAAFVCAANKLGDPVSVEEAERAIFGYVLMNDWSARDVQAWEYVPLGPFGAKNFGTSVSPWVVLADALEPFRTAGLRVAGEDDGGDTLLPYLQADPATTAFDIKLQVDIIPRGGQEGEASGTAGTGTTTVCRTNASNLLYSMAQMIAHHTVTGCNLNVGDLLGSGTISGTTDAERGSLMEVTENGKKWLELSGGEKRMFLEDGDEVVFSGMAGSAGAYVGFGECRGVVLPAHPLKS